MFLFLLTVTRLVSYLDCFSSEKGTRETSLGVECHV